ncbi:MAG: DUF4159 domain-containing protein, partial [Gemmatimonadetes bacterium]|nr:DUF4159 domain-containing protein [Gemmatimonadota bacterium]
PLRRLVPTALALAVLGGSFAPPAEGQGRRRGGFGFGSDLEAYQQYNTEYSGLFTFVRLYYHTFGSGGRGGPGWSHDWPVAETNFGKIMDALTTVSPRLGGGNVLAMDDPELFKYPVAYLSEPGFWRMTEAETENLRNYLLKGGFLILDDNAGPRDWYNLEQQFHLLLPGYRLVELDASHPVFDSFFHLEDENIQMPHPYGWGMASYWGIFEDNDPDRRLMVIVNRDNDIGDYMEWSDRGFIPIELSNEAYKLGVNYVIYALTH